MKNLKNYQVQELSVNEMKEVEGGGFLSRWASFMVYGYGYSMKNHYDRGGSFCDWKNA